MAERRQHIISISRRGISFTRRELREIHIWREDYEARKRKDYRVSIDEARAMISD